MEKENEDRFQSIMQKPVYWCRSPIEWHAAKIYTRGIYLKFVTELVNSTAFGVHEVVKDRVYELKKTFHYEHPEYRRDLFTVFVDKRTTTVECECGKYEKDGILCCHILRLFTQWDVVRIPDQYILPRWTSDFREKELIKQKQEILEVHGSEATQSALRYAMLMNNLNDLCADISRDANKSKEFIEEVQKLHKRLMSGDEQQTGGLLKGTVLKDPPVLKKASSKSKKDTERKVDSDPKTSTVATGESVNIWVNPDGSTSKEKQDDNIVEKVKESRKRKQVEDGPLKDPPVSSAKSVNKGDRMKPQSEKNANRKRKTQNKKEKVGEI
jgi:hypothetical protein